jgi:predicted transcriptional regulator of viral defense system
LTPTSTTYKIDKVLQRLVQQGQLRRIDRGLYDVPRVNRLTRQPAVADYRRIIDAIGRRDQVRMLVDGMTAANDLGLTTAVPARVVIHTDARRRTIRLDNSVIEFKQTAPSKLYWAGRPAMRIVQRSTGSRTRCPATEAESCPSWPRC